MRKWSPYPEFLACLLLGMAVFQWVDLSPKVGTDFFFSSADPAFEEAKQIRAQFPSHEQLIVSVESADIQSASYQERIQTLAGELSALPQVISVRSLGNGPSNFEDANSSPLWRNLLLGTSGNSTLIVALVDADKNRTLIQSVEQITATYDSSEFKTRLSGTPYVVEMIRRQLTSDLKVFTSSAIAVFSVALLVVFRSLKVVAGAVSACTAAVFSTLLGVSLFGGGLALSPLI